MTTTLDLDLCTNCKAMSAAGQEVLINLAHQLGSDGNRHCVDCLDRLDLWVTPPQGQPADPRSLWSQIRWLAQAAANGPTQAFGRKIEELHDLMAELTEAIDA